MLEETNSVKYAKKGILRPSVEVTSLGITMTSNIHLNLMNILYITNVEKPS